MDGLAEQRRSSVGVREDAGTSGRVLAVGLALASLFHLAGNPALGDGAPRPITLVVVQAAVGVSALAVLLAPGRHVPVLVLAAALPVSAWVEAPAVGNHWVLAAAVGLTYLLAATVTAARRGRAEQTAALAVPAVRLVLLVAYSFAALAKLNSGFLDPATSCAVLYQDQLVGSWGLDALSVQGAPAPGRAVAIGAATVELSVPLLLLVRRTRPWGVLLALTFHWTLALDLQQHFWDFSSVLFPLFLLFLDPHRLGSLVTAVAGARDRLPAGVRRVAVAAGVALAVLATAAGALGQPLGLRVVAALGGHVAWWVLGTATLVLAARAVVSSRGEPVAATRLRPAPVMLLVPALVAFNGLTPYLELKTGYGWNMYSNLRTVAGETNHLLVPATWDLTGLQHDRVTVLESTDPALLARQGYEPVWSEFVEYAHRHPEETVAYVRQGRVHRSPTLAADPATAGRVSEVSYRLQSFRAVDVSGAERCLDSFGPAR